MKKPEEIGYEKVLYKCMNCENTFEDLRFAGELYGYRTLFCEKCTYHALVDFFSEDDKEISSRVTKELDEYELYKKLKNKGGITPRDIEFGRRFDETVDPCPKCGGKLSLSAKRKCPKCLSTNLRDIKGLGGITIKAPWVTHNKMKNKQANVNQ